MKTIFIFSVIILFITIGACFAENKTSHRFVDKTIAGIVVGKDTEEEIIRKFGKGTKIQKGYAWCYYSVTPKQFLIFELGPDKVISAINISTEYYPGPECVTISIKHRKNLATGKGVRLGNSSEEVIKIYGKPERKKIKGGKLIFEYHTDHTKDPQVSLYL